MRHRYLGTSSRQGQSPTLYATDHDTYLVQGWKIADAGAGVIEIPHELLTYLEVGTCLGVRLEDTGKGTFRVWGTPVTDPHLLAGLAVPDHEQCIEVPRTLVIRPDEQPLAPQPVQV
ncbi:hypothetical protein [Nocardia sp. NPDC003183]